MIEKRKLLSAALKLLKAVHDAARKQAPWGFGRSRANFARDVRDIVRSFWRDEIEYYDFIDGMYDIVVSGYEEAWAEGAATCGILPEEFTTDELDFLDEMIYAAWDPSISFADQIETNRRALGGKLGPLYTRAELWINKYDAVKALAQRIACRDQKLAWVYNPRKEHCEDCLNLHGRVYRASVWDRYGIAPQSPGLACGGWRCGCRFVVTDDPVTPGRPPHIGG